MDQNYNVSKKLANGKWWTFGKVRLNKFGKYDLGMRVTTELRELLKSTLDGAYLNFSLFPDDRDDYRSEQQRPKSDSKYTQTPESTVDDPAFDTDGEVPF